MPDALAAATDGWTKRSERFDPDREPFATCLYEGERGLFVRVEVFAERPRRLDAVRAAPGWLVLMRVTSDPALPALAALLAQPGATIVRYSAGRRCTVYVAGRFAKVYAGGRARRAFANGLLLAEAGELGFAVAQPELRDDTVWHAALAGERVGPRLYARGDAALARRIGRAAASLSRSPIRPSIRRDLHAELVRTERRCAELERRVPALRDPLRRLLGALEAADVAEQSLGPVHGALHASQWLDDGSRLALLDYDALALGPPELDAATFLADTDVQNRERVPVDALNAAFLDGFESVAGPLDERLLAVHRAHRRLEKALRVARTLRPDGDEKAARRLRGALVVLEALE
jgi:hypothetical protein